MDLLSDSGRFPSAIGWIRRLSWPFFLLWFMGGNCLSTASNNSGCSSSMNDPVIIPPSAKHTATVFFFHGLGDTGHGWAAAFQGIKSPHIKYVCPTASVLPVTLNGGFPMPSWFDILGLSPDSGEDENGIKSAARNVQSWIEEEIKLGIPSDRIMLGGFSQGGALALYSCFTYDKPLAGVVALSAWLPLHKQLPGEHKTNASVPILQCHGEQDPLVIPLVGHLTSANLKSLTTDHRLKMYPQMGHSSCEAELLDVRKFILEKLPPQ